MAARQRQIPVNGIQMGELPEGTTVMEFTKRHQPEPRNDAPSADEAESFDWVVYRMDSGTPAFLGQHEGLPGAPEVAERYSVGLYHLVPLDPQTRREIPGLKRSLRVAPPQSAMGLQPAPQSAPAAAPQSYDAHLVLLEQQRLDAKEERQRLESERQRLDAEARQTQMELAREQAEQRRADRERSDKMLELGLGLLGTLAAGLPAALAGLKTMLAPPPSADSKVVDTLTAELHTMRAKLDKASEKQPDPFEATLNRLMQVRAHKALLEELKDADDDDDSTMGMIKEGLGMAREALPMLGSMRGGQQAQPEQYAFSSPEALTQTVLRDPAAAERTLQELARQNPEMARMVVNTLQAGAPRQVEQDDDAPVPIGKRRAS